MIRVTLKPSIAGIILAVSALLSAHAAGAGMPMPSKNDFSSKAYSYRTGSPEPEMQSLVASGMPAARRTDGLAYVRSVVSTIRAATGDEFMQVKMAHDFIALTIEYDGPAYLSGNIPPQDFISVLRRETAVCEGFANTFKTFCDELGVKCKVVHGYSRGKGFSLESEGGSKPSSNHAWNIVSIKGKKYLVDCTWDEGYMNGSTTTRDYKTEWLFAAPETFIYSHYPTDSRSDQLLANKVSWKEFVSLPSLRPSFFDAVRKCHPKLGRLNKCKGKLGLELKLAESYSMSVSVTNSSTGENVRGCYAIKTDGDKTMLTFIFPQPGTYKVTFFPYKLGASKSTSCGEFLVRRE
ncbi:MAG: hypothetical protein K6G18_07930 [Treponema sp.]|nr:hypothetical protein [Treponema sp.]